MNEIVIDKKEELVMKLLHYFITERGYNPVIIRGIKDEIWLENLDDDYKIIRIVSGYIHNNEQFKFDLFKTKNLLKTIKKKTLSFKINALSIFVNLGDNVDISQFEDVPNIKFADIHDEEDLNKYRFVTSAFPDITKDMDFKEKGLELFMKITSDINKKNEGDAKMNEDVFRPKKPVITYALIIINVIVFILSMFNDNILQMFAVNRFYIADLGEYYRLFTGIFLHAGVLHILFNMYALYVIGMQLESFLGKWKYLAVYFQCFLYSSIMALVLAHLGLYLV